MVGGDERPRHELAPDVVITLGGHEAIRCRFEQAQMPLHRAASLLRALPSMDRSSLHDALFAHEGPQPLWALAWVTLPVASRKSSWLDVIAGPGRMHAISGGRFLPGRYWRLVRSLGQDVKDPQPWPRDRQPDLHVNHPGAHPELEERRLHPHPQQGGLTAGHAGTGISGRQE